MDTSLTAGDVSTTAAGRAPSLVHDMEHSLAQEVRATVMLFGLVLLVTAGFTAASMLVLGLLAP